MLLGRATSPKDIELLIRATRSLYCAETNPKPRLDWATEPCSPR
jgi:hypothetical protein